MSNTAQPTSAGLVKSMGRSKYQQALSDWETLWKVGAAHDMTGGYVDQQDLDRLLRNPTKAMATKCLISQINYWFEAGIETGTEKGKPAALVLAEHPHLEPLAIRYGYEHLLPDSSSG